MYICNCNGLNEQMVEDSIAGGAKSVRDVYRRSRCIARCGRCAPEICERLRQACTTDDSVLEPIAKTGSA